jgi:lambda family phage holin
VHDREPNLWALIFTWLLPFKEQATGAFLSAVMACLRGGYNNWKPWKMLIDSLMCAIFAWFILDILDYLELKKELAYIGSVIIGYLGTDYIGNLLCRIIEKK